MSQNYTFIVADDHGVTRKGTTYTLKDLYPDSVIFEASVFSEISKFITAEKIDLLLLDINFPDTLSLSVIHTIKKLQPSIKILIFSAFDEDIYAVRYLNAGVNGYQNKFCKEAELKKAVDSVLLSGKYLSQNIQNKIMDSFLMKRPSNPLQQLSNREIEIARLMVEGNDTNFISSNLNIKRATVSTYKNRIFEKLKITSLASLIDLFSLFFYNKS